MNPYSRTFLIGLFVGLVLGIFLALVGTAIASQVYVPQHHHKCRHGYRRVVRHKHKHRVVVCVKKVSVGARPPATKLHAHLDPTYTRDPNNPFKVSYDYSASATKESVAQARNTSIPTVEEPTALPSGVLSLFSDGKLECAINVGGDLSGSACPVTYSSLGEHNVTTIYTSGEESATTTEVENIEPLSSSLEFSVIYHAEPPEEESRTEQIGTIEVIASTQPNRGASIVLCSSGSCNNTNPVTPSPLNGVVQIAVFEKLPMCNGAPLEEDEIMLKAPEFTTGWQSAAIYEEEDQAFKAILAAPGYITSESTTPIHIDPLPGHTQHC